MHIYIGSNVNIDEYQLNSMIEVCAAKLKEFFGDIQILDNREYTIIKKPRTLYKIYAFNINIDNKIINKAKLTNYVECMKYFNEIVPVDTLLLISGANSTFRNYFIQLVN